MLPRSSSARQPQGEDQALHRARPGDARLHAAARAAGRRRGRLHRRQRSPASGRRTTSTGATWSRTCKANGLDPGADAQLVIQFNKKDLPGATTDEAIEKMRRRRAGSRSTGGRGARGGGGGDASIGLAPAHLPQISNSKSTGISREVRARPAENSSMGSSGMPRWTQGAARSSRRRDGLRTRVSRSICSRTKIPLGELLNLQILHQEVCTLLRGAVQDRPEGLRRHAGTSWSTSRSARRISAATCSPARNGRRRCTATVTHSEGAASSTETRSHTVRCATASAALRYLMMPLLYERRRRSGASVFGPFVPDDVGELGRRAQDLQGEFDLAKAKRADRPASAARPRPPWPRSSSTSPGWWTCWCSPRTGSTHLVAAPHRERDRELPRGGSRRTASLDAPTSACRNSTG